MGILRNTSTYSRKASSVCISELPPPQSPSFFIREFGNECEAGACGKEESKKRGTVSPLLPFPSFPARYRFERATGEEAASRKPAVRLSCK